MLPTRVEVTPPVAMVEPPLMLMLLFRVPALPWLAMVPLLETIFRVTLPTVVFW
ncbi:hypothetical protein D3C83_232340 [compost metagenome]